MTRSHAHTLAALGVTVGALATALVVVIFVTVTR